MVEIIGVSRGQLREREREWVNFHAEKVSHLYPLQPLTIILVTKSTVIFAFLCMAVVSSHRAS